MATVSVFLTPNEVKVKTATFGYVTRVQGTNFPVDCLIYDPSTNWDAFWILTAEQYASGNPTLDIVWEGDTATTGAVKWECAIGCVAESGGSTSIETKALATAQNGTTTTSGTAAAPNKTTITITNTDSISSTMAIILRVTRLANDGADTMTTNAKVLYCRFNYSNV